MALELKGKDTALILVDLQNDFCKSSGPCGGGHGGGRGRVVVVLVVLNF
jgi:nicotinamidase-related amidase